VNFVVKFYVFGKISQILIWVTCTVKNGVCHAGVCWRHDTRALKITHEAVITTIIYNISD